MFYNTRLFMACHRFSYSVTFRHRFGFLNYVKDLFSALRFTFCIYCYVLALSYVTGFTFTLLGYVYHMCPVINRISGLDIFIVIITSFR